MNDFFKGTKRKVFIDKSLRYICWTKDLESKSIDLQEVKKKGKKGRENKENESNVVSEIE